MANFWAKHQTWPYNLKSGLEVSRNYHELVMVWQVEFEMEIWLAMRMWKIGNWIRNSSAKKGIKQGTNPNTVSMQKRGRSQYWGGHLFGCRCLQMLQSLLPECSLTLPFAPENKSWTLNACSRPRIKKHDINAILQKPKAWVAKPFNRTKFCQGIPPLTAATSTLGRIAVPVPATLPTCRRATPRATPRKRLGWKFNTSAWWALDGLGNVSLSLL